MTQAEETLRYAAEHAGSWLPHLPCDARLAVRDAVLAHLLALSGAGGGPGTVSDLASELFDRLGHLNVDWELVSLTEVGECHLQGFIASVEPGTSVRRMESYAGACKICSALHGRTFTVVASGSPGKDWATQVWRGKSAIYGTAATATENPGWPWAGLQHPGCRGMWLAGPPTPRPGASPEFLDFMKRFEQRGSR